MGKQNLEMVQVFRCLALLGNDLIAWQLGCVGLPAKQLGYAALKNNLRIT
jgi:hypothetical protein